MVQRILRDDDIFESELFKLWELKALDGAVTEVTICDGDNTEGGGEAKDGGWQRNIVVKIGVGAP